MSDTKDLFDSLLEVLKAPVEELDREGQRLLLCIRSSEGFSGRNCISGSADFQSLVPKVKSLRLKRRHIQLISIQFGGKALRTAPWGNNRTTV